MFEDLTLFIIKPNAIRKNVIGDILNFFEREGLKVLALKTVWMDREQAREFYKVHKGKPFFESLTEFMSSSPVVVGVLKGENAVERARRIMGATDPARAESGTIRAKYGDNIQENAVHGSDSIENAQREIKFFFSEYEIVKLLEER